MLHGCCCVSRSQTAILFWLYLEVEQNGGLAIDARLIVFLLCMCTSQGLVYTTHQVWVIYIHKSSVAI